MKLVPLILCLSMIAGLKSMNFTIKEIISGITFVKEAHVSLSYQKWNMVYYYDLNSYFEQIKLFEKIIDEMHRACDLLKIDGSTCLSLIIKFEKYQEKIEHSKSIIKRYKLDGKIRTQRSLIPQIGTVLKALFGIIDEEQAEIYNKKIIQLEKNAKQKGEFSNERLSIIQSSLMTNDKRFKELTIKIITLSTQLRSLNATTFEKTSQTLISDNFNYLAHSATLIMIDHNRISDIIMQLLTNTISTKITELIPANTLQENLRDISFSLAIGKKLPIDVERDNIYEIFNVIDIKSTVVQEKLLMVISIPIVNEISYNLFRAVSIPTEYKNEAVMIQSSTEYLLANIAASHFLPITSAEYTNCLRKTENQIICNPASPIYLNKHYKCEFCLFNEIDIQDLEIHCENNIRKIPRKNYFIKLDAPNYYYVYVNSPITIRSICTGREPEEMLVSNHGILLVEDQCIIKTDGLLIEASHTVNNRHTITLESPKFNISELTKLSYVVGYDSNRTNNNKGQDDGDVTLLENFDIETNELLRRVEQAREKEHKLEFQIDENVDSYSWFKMIYSFVIFMIICGIIIMIIKLFHNTIKCMS